MRSDRADNEELYRTRTFKDQPIGKFSILDEMDLPGGLHGMKYHFIQENLPAKLFELERHHEFIYWGCDKRKLIDNIESGDERHIVFKQIKKNAKIKSYFIGKYNAITPDKKIDSMYNLLTDLTCAKSTLCFNWLDPAATTSRYHEAMACGIPVVSFNTGGPAELIKDGENGYLIPKDDLEGFCSRIKGFYNNPEQLDVIGQNGIQQAKQF